MDPIDRPRSSLKRQEWPKAISKITQHRHPRWPYRLIVYSYYNADCRYDAPLPSSGQISKSELLSCATTSLLNPQLHQRQCYVIVTTADSNLSFQGFVKRKSRKKTLYLLNAISGKGRVKSDIPYASKHMPESTDSVPQPSFTSSTYRAIAENGPLIPTSDRPFSEQPDVQAFLNARNQGVVSETFLYRLLTVVEMALNRKFPDIQMGGICLGYYLTKKHDTSEKIPKFQYAAWGWEDTYCFFIDPREDSVPEALEEESQEMFPEEDPIGSQLELLSKLVEQEIAAKIPLEILEKNDLNGFLFGHVKDDFLPIFSGTMDSDLQDGTESTEESIRLLVRIRGNNPCNCPGDKTKKTNQQNPSGPCISGCR